MKDALDDAPEMVPFITGAELERRGDHWPWRVMTKDEELAAEGKAAHTTVGGKGIVARLRERRRLERSKR